MQLTAPLVLPENIMIVMHKVFVLIARRVPIATLLEQISVLFVLLALSVLDLIMQLTVNHVLQGNLTTWRDNSLAGRATRVNTQMLREVLDVVHVLKGLIE